MPTAAVSALKVESREEGIWLVASGSSISIDIYKVFQPPCSVFQNKIEFERQLVGLCFLVYAVYLVGYDSG